MNKWLKGFALAALIALGANAQNSHDLLINAKDAIKLLDKKNVVFVSGDSHDVFEAQGHIKGSVEMYAHHLHHSDITGHMHCAPLFMCPDEAKEYIESKGISNDTTIIAYDNFRGPNATGVYAFFRSWGHKNIKILDGGMAAIKKADPNQAIYDKMYEESRAIRKNMKAAKKAKDAEKTAMYKAEYKAIKAKLKTLSKKLLIQKGKGHHDSHKGHYDIDLKKVDYGFIAGKEELLKAVLDIREKGDESKYVVIDTRAMTEIIGQRKLDNVARGGHMPGAKLIEWTQIYDKDKELSFRDFDDIQKVMDKYGVTRDKTVYAYCHVGAGRSSHIITALHMLGYKNVKVYVGSWDEWGNDMNLPITR
jgi:thiosulfate/3-mercaptopyruvate sulfurtransferase